MNQNQKVKEQLMEGIEDTLNLMDVSLSEITNVEANAGGIWLTYEGKEYCIIIEQCAKENETNKHQP